MFFIPTKVNIGDMKINSPDHKSEVSFGSNFLLGINVSGKKSQGFGQQMADLSTTAVPIHIVIDNEIIDCPTIKVNK